MVPNLPATLHSDHRVLESNVFEYDVFFEKEPVGDPDTDFSRIQQRILLLVFYQYSLEMHVIEQGKINAVYFDTGMQVFGEAFGNLINDPVLPDRGLDKNPYSYH